MVIALVSNKGGVGKSTLAIHLAALAHERGARVALIDCDGLTRSASVWHAELGANFELHQLFTHDDVFDQVPGIAKRAGLVVADGAAALSEVSRALLLVCDLALIPCAPSGLDVRGVHEALRVARQIQKVVRDGAPQVCLIPNRLQSGYRLSRELLESLSALGVPAFEGLRQRQAYAEAGTQGTTVWKLPRAEEAAQEFYRLYDQIDHHAKTKKTKP